MADTESGKSSGALSAGEVLVGDIIRVPFGMHREIETVTIHAIHIHDDGALSVRFRYTSNPRGIDWSGFIPADENALVLVARGVAQVDNGIRSLLPS